MYWRTTVESAQKIDLSMLISNSSLNVRSSLTASTAADSSSLGTVIGLTWVKCVFAATKLQWIFLASLMNLKEKTAPFAICHASAKWWISVGEPKSIGLKLRGIAMSESFGNSESHQSQRKISSWPMSSPLNHSLSCKGLESASSLEE